MRVSVFGLGYVGAVSCACLAKDGAEVLGVDVNPDKVQLINDGHLPIVEESIGDLIADAVRRGRLKATVDVDEAIAGTDVSLISVGTPSEPNGSLSLTAVQRVALSGRRSPCSRRSASVADTSTRWRSRPKT